MKVLNVKFSTAAISAAAAVLLACSTWFLLSKARLNRKVSTDLSVASARMEVLTLRDPAAGSATIQAAKFELEKLDAFLQNVEKHFLPAPCPAQLGNMEFRAYLDTTVAQLRRDAAESGVELPHEYWFSFAAQKGAMTFASESLEPLARQLSEIDLLCRALFRAKVNTMEWVKRVPVEKSDILGSQDYLSTKATTNELAVIMPYELCFQGFPSELERFLENLAELPQFFAVANLVVEAVGPAVSSGIPSWPTRVWPPEYVRSHVPQLPDRHQTPGQTRRRIVQSGPQTVISGKLLRFIVSVEAVRVNPAKRASTGLASKRP